MLGGQDWPRVLGIHWVTSRVPILVVKDLLQRVPLQSTVRPSGKVTFQIPDKLLFLPQIFPKKVYLKIYFWFFLDPVKSAILDDIFWF